MPVFSEVVGLVLGASGLVFASDYGDFLRYEFLRWGCSEVPVIGWVLANRVDVSLDCFGVLVITECSMDCFFPRESELPDIFEHVGWAPFRVSMLVKKVALYFE